MPTKAETKLRALLKAGLRSLRHGRHDEARTHLLQVWDSAEGASVRADVGALLGALASEPSLAHWSAAAGGDHFAVALTLERVGVLHGGVERLGRCLPALGEGASALYATLARRLGRFREAVRTLREIDTVSARRMLAHLLAECGDHDGSLALVTDASTRIATLIAAGRHQDARQLAARVPSLSVEELVAAGALDRAQKNASPEWAARFASWRGDYRDRKEATPLVRGICALQRGDRSQAKPLLERARRGTEAAQAYLWLGELAQRENDDAAALTLIDRGITLSHGYPLAGHLARLACVMKTYGPRWNAAAVDDELLHTVMPMFGESEPAGDPSLPLAQRALTHALVMFAGNRSVTTTYMRPCAVTGTAKLTVLDHPVHSRFLCRIIQETIRVQPIAHVVARLGQLAVERDDAPTIHCHIGELYLWGGDYEAAHTAFERALSNDERVRWAHIGLAAAALGAGDAKEAIARCDHGIRVVPPPGRTLFPYRGEAHRIVGNRAAAEADLRHGLELTPHRISSWINLALLSGSAADIDACFDRVARRAPGLVGDAIQEVPRDRAAQLAHMLTMMRGNRSSSFVTYFAADDLRFVPPPSLTR